MTILLGLQRRYPLLQVVLLIALWGYGAATIDGFTDRSSIYSVLILSAFLGLAGAGQTVVILLGGIDFSIPAVVSCATVLTAELTGRLHWPFAAALALILGLAALIGAVNGWLCHRFGVQPLILTLGMGAAITGALLVWINGAVTGASPEWLARLSSPIGTTFGVPIPPSILLWALVAVVLGVVLRRTIAGRRIYLTGANPRAAELTLVRTRRVWAAGFMVSALCAAVVGVLLAGFSGSGSTTIGDPYLFQGLTAVIVGGTMMGGRGDYWRTALGALLLTVLSTILLGLGFSTSDQQILFGVLILAVVAGYGRDQRLRDRV